MTPADFHHWLTARARRTLVMGVLNVTPDSFSDGGQFDAVDAAVVHARRMIDDGADLIDIGGESTRPGAARTGVDEQIARVVPVLRACRELPVTFSIDTTRAAVARAAMDAGASVVNDVSAGRDDPDMIGLVARSRCPVILMHMRGQPATMQADPVYDNVTANVAAFLKERARAFEAAGVAPHRILIDPGIGFGKTLDHNLALLRELAALTSTPYLVVVGTSRKGFIGKLLNRPDPADRVFGTAASVAWAVAHGAAIVRVHDVGAMKDVVTLIDAIRNAPPADGR